MKRWPLSPRALFAGCVLVAACSQTTQPSTFTPDRGGGSPNTSAADGANPQAGLLAVDGVLYGTTYFGGSTYGCDRSGCGTVFSITTAGTETVLHSFQLSPDGHSPTAALIDVGGTLYGATTTGGTSGCRNGCGTVFSITTSGKENVLYSFQKHDTGGRPGAALVDASGTLYGTTPLGGSSRQGTVFSVTTSGSWTLLHSFAGEPDGAYPQSSLLDVKGTLYGTTTYGGSYGNGTVFTITPNGTERVLYSFQGGTDGANPSAALIDAGGTLYGTTSSGGTYDKRGSLGGTVYSITPNGTEKVLHSFAHGADGADPEAPLIEVKGILYGTTNYGGTYSNCPGNCGTVFSITSDGTEKVLHSFSGKPDGANPQGGFVDAGGTLFSTTAWGGAHKDGTVFSITRSGAEKVLYSFRGDKKNR